MKIPEISVYLVAALLAWFGAQGTKYILSAKKNGKRDVRAWYQSGNMPSAHTATMVALTTVVAYRDGIESGLFAVTLVITAITMFDSMMSRRASGEQGIAVRKLLSKSSFANDPLPYHALGHRPQEVLVGALLGLLVGTAVAFLITQ